MMKVVHIFFALLIINTPVNASIVNNGIYTTDTDTGLDWLDLTETKGLSVTNVYSNYISSGNWRYASGDQLNQLIFNYSGSVTNGYDSTDQPAHRIDGLIDLLGPTGNTGFQVFNNGHYIFGLLKEFTTELNCAGLSCIATNQSWVASMTHYAIDSITVDILGTPTTIALTDYSKTHDFKHDQTEPRADIGSFLIRDTTSSSVPLPSAIWLLVSGLFAVFGISRRKS